MKKIDFVNGTTIDGAETFNDMQQNVEEVFNGEEAMESIRVADVKCKQLLDKYNPRIVHGYHNIDTKEWINDGGSYSFVIEIEPNKDYTISKPSGTQMFDISTAPIIDEIATITANAYDVDEIHIRTGENDKYLIGYFTWSQTPINVTQALDGIQVEEGNVATPITYYKKFGYNSHESMGKIIVDDIRSKNMIDISQFNNGYLSSIGDIVSNPDLLLHGEKFCDYIKVEPNTTYTFTIFETSTNHEDWIGIQEFDTNKSFITRIVKENSRTFEFTTGSTTHYVMLSARNLVGATKVQFELGKATSYTPYKNLEGRVDIIPWREIPTNEYIDGKRVYVKRINHGALNVKTGYTFVSTEIPANNAKIVRTYISAVNPTNPNQIINLPAYLNANEYCHTNTLVIDNTIYYVYSGAEGALAGYELITETYYTKTTDTSSASTMSLRPDTTEDETTSLEETE